jgi:hypothetical protein
MIGRAEFLAELPDALRGAVLKTFLEIAANYVEHRWEPSELNGGKFCEAVHTILLGSVRGAFPVSPSKPPSLVDACRALEKCPENSNRVGDRSLRILIPRVLPALYEIRNNRGVGHIGGDVDPNFLDATAVYAMASWVLAELVRIFHNVSTKEAQEAVDALVERKIPLIWEVPDINIRRVQEPEMDHSDQVLLLLHQRPAWVLERDLVAWVEYSSSSMFRTRVLQPLHKSRLIELDAKRRRARISPLGSKDVEQRILMTRH